MKKYFLFIFFLAISLITKAQKYALIDQTLTNPIRLTDVVTQADISNKLFPVEKKELKNFTNALTSIYNQLKLKSAGSEALNFNMGCVTIEGKKLILQGEERYCYTLNFNCENVQEIYLLCDCKLKNSINAFIVNVWIKYLHKNMASLNKK